VKALIEEGLKWDLDFTDPKTRPIKLEMRRLIKVAKNKKIGTPYR